METWVGFVTIIGILILILVIIKLIPNTSSKTEVNETPESTSRGVNLTFSALFNTPPNNKIYPAILNREFIEPLAVANNSRSNCNSLVSELNQIIIEPKGSPPPYIINQEQIDNNNNNNERVYDFSEDFKLRQIMKLVTC